MIININELWCRSKKKFFNSAVCLLNLIDNWAFQENIKQISDMNMKSMRTENLRESVLSTTKRTALQDA